MASEPKVGEVRTSDQLIYYVCIGNDFVPCSREQSDRLSVELSAAREMREVLSLCLPCIDEEIHDPRTLVDRRDSLTVLRRRVARLIGGGE